MQILSPHYLSTNVKGHNDISIKSYAQPVFFPGGLQSDLFWCCVSFRACVLDFSITSSYTRPAGSRYNIVAKPATRNYFKSEAGGYGQRGETMIELL